LKAEHIQIEFSMSLVLIAMIPLLRRRSSWQETHKLYSITCLTVIDEKGIQVNQQIHAIVKWMTKKGKEKKAGRGENSEHKMTHICS